LKEKWFLQSVNAKFSPIFWELHAFFLQKCSRNFLWLISVCKLAWEKLCKAAWIVADLLCKYAKENNSQLGKGLYG